ncbi:MAG: hypothetical protein ACYDA9_06605 [Terriglobia bacterium]
MKRRFVPIAVFLIAAGIAGVAPAREKSLKPGPLTGTWECTSHGSSRGDMEFTLDLQQEKETVAGSVTSPIGSADLSSASFKHKILQIQIDSDQGDYLLTAKLKDGRLSGEWSHGDEKGTWEGKKQAPDSK